MTEGILVSRVRFIREAVKKFFNEPCCIGYIGSAHSFQVVLPKRITKVCFRTNAKHARFYREKVNLLEEEFIPKLIRSGIVCGFYISFFNWIEGVNVLDLRKCHRCDLSFEYYIEYGKRIRFLNDLGIFPSDGELHNVLYSFNTDSLIYCDSTSVGPTAIDMNNFLTKLCKYFVDKDQYREAFMYGYNKGS